MTTTTIQKALGLDDYDLPTFIAKSADAGDITKAELGELLNRRALRQKQPSESPQQAYSRLFADGQDTAGAELFKTYMGLRGPDEHQAAALKALSVHDEPKLPESRERPFEKLEALAAELRKGTALTREQAFARAVDTPEGMVLFKADKAERFGFV